MGAIQNNIKSIVDNQKMGSVQYAVVIICFIMNMLDGMDVLVIAFTASAITKEWGISSEALGVVFSSAVLGMTLGALFIAPLADKIGRKTLILICASIMGASIFMTSYAGSVNLLIFYRFISGLGIGGMLASVSTLASEYSPNKSKDFWVSLVLSGYPIGAVMAGLVSAEIIPDYGWRAMYQFAGVTTLVTIPLAAIFLSESLEYLVRRRTRNSLSKVNRILRKMGTDQLETLPVLTDEGIDKSSVRSLFKGERKAYTLFLWLAFFMSFATLYFLLSWIPKLSSAAGLSERLAIYSGTVFNLGAFIGILILGAFAIKLGLRKTIFTFLSGAAILMMVFGSFSGSAVLLIMFGVIGCSMQGGFVGLYPLAARLYPSEIRATGIGWAIGAGRLGAVLGPILAGYLIGAGLSLTANFIIFAIPCVIAGVAVLKIKI